jgi:hypothetical protein
MHIGFERQVQQYIKFRTNWSTFVWLEYEKPETVAGVLGELHVPC